MSLEDISTLYAEDLAVSAEEEDARHPDKILEHSEENCKFTAEIRVFSQLMAQMVRKMDEQRDGVYGQTVLLLKLQTDKMAVDLRDLRNIVAETREKYSTQITELVQVVKELKEEISARTNDSHTELVQVVKELKEEISARTNDSHTELVQVVKELKEEMAALRNFARQNDSPTELVEVVKELKEEMSALRTFARQNDSQDFYQQMLGAGTRHPPSEDSDYNESIINVTSLYPGSEEVVKLTNFLEEMKSQQDSEVSKGTGTEQLPTDSSEEEALAKNEDGSGVIINNTREDNVKMINPIPETVSDSKFANFQEEMQGELDNGISNKEIKLLLANESVEDSPAMENTKSVVTNNTEGSVELRTLNPETVGGEMQGELDNGMVPKVAESTVPMKESVEDATAKGDGSSVILNKNTEEVTEQKPTKKNDENVEDNDQDDSIAVTKIAEEDTVENSSVCLQMEYDSTSASSQQKMQSKLDDSKVNKVTEQLTTNERKDNASAMEVRDSVLLNESIKEDNDKNISLYPESEDDNKLANSDEDIQSKPASKGQLPTKEKDDVKERNQEDSIAITKIVKKDTFENSSESLKTEDDAQSVISHQKIQKKFDGGKGNKVTEQLAINERKDDAPAMEDRASTLLNEGIKEDGDKNISLYPESEDDNKLANSDEEIQSKPASKGQLLTKEKDDVENRNQEGSVAVTKIAKEDTFGNSPESLKTEDDAQSVISQPEIQKKVDGVTEQLATDERKDTASAMGVRDFVVHKLASEEQLQIKKNVGVAPKKPEKESVSITNNTGKGTVDNSSSQRLEKVEEARSVNSQQEMQRKLDVIEQLPTNKSVEYVQAKDEDDSVAITNSTKEDNAKSSSIRLKTKGDSKLAQQKMQNEIESGGTSKAERKQLPPTESVKDVPAAKGDGCSVVNKDDTEDDNLKFAYLYQETEEAAKLEKLQQKMQSKEDGKYYDYTDINGYHEASIPYL
ncbi:enolase-phosphatase E1 [Magallana gigas]|uniref:enolase-phosphatase E1 n=1 Tax=Magallana gigas TaxID=29159 RepID=UPI0033417D0F